MKIEKIDQEAYYTLKQLGGWVFSERTWRRRIERREITYLKTGAVLIKGQWLLEYLEKRRICAENN